MIKFNCNKIMLYRILDFLYRKYSKMVMKKNNEIFYHTNRDMQLWMTNYILKKLKEEDLFVNKRYELLRSKRLRNISTSLNASEGNIGIENYYSRDKRKASSVISQLLSNKRKYTDEIVSLICENLEIETTMLVFGVSSTYVDEIHLTLHLTSIFDMAFLSDKYFKDIFNILINLSSLAEEFVYYGISSNMSYYEIERILEREDVRLSFTKIANKFVSKLTKIEIKGKSFFENYYEFVSNLKSPLKNLEKTNNEILLFLIENYFPYLTKEIGESYGVLKYSLLRIANKCIQENSNLGYNITQEEFSVTDFNLTEKTKILVRISELLELLDKNESVFFD